MESKLLFDKELLPLVLVDGNDLVVVLPLLDCVTTVDVEVKLPLPNEDTSTPFIFHPILIVF